MQTERHLLANVDSPADKTARLQASAPPASQPT